VQKEEALWHQVVRWLNSNYRAHALRNASICIQAVAVAAEAIPQ
jgi:hypothetical protein